MTLLDVLMKPNLLKISLDNLQPFLEQFELPDDIEDRLAVLRHLECLIASIRQQVEYELEALRTPK